MTWHLTVRFQETELRDAYWEQATAMPQLAPVLEAAELRTRLYLAWPGCAFEHTDRAALAPLARWTLDFWPSAQMELSSGSRSLADTDSRAAVCLETIA